MIGAMILSSELQIGLMTVCSDPHALSQLFFIFSKDLTRFEGSQDAQNYEVSYFSLLSSKTHKILAR